MSMVHGSGGINKPASKELRSEIAIIAGMAAAAVGSAAIDWAGFAADYDRIRAAIAATIPGFSDYNTRVRKPRGFKLRNLAAERVFETATGRANFSADALPDETEHQAARKTHDTYVLQTFRSHDQYNTTIYGWMTAIAASTASAAWSSPIRTTSRRFARGWASAWTSSGRMRTASPGGPRISASCRSTCPAARWRATIRS